MTAQKLKRLVCQAIDEHAQKVIDLGFREYKTAATVKGKIATQLWCSQ